MAEEEAGAETMEEAMGDAMGMDEGSGNISLEAVYDSPVQISVVLGKTAMQVNQLLKLGRGAVIELDRKVGEPIDIFVNNRLVARGEADIYPRFGPTMEWDTAAGQAIAVASGARVVRHDDGRILTDNKEDLLNPWFIAAGDGDLPT